MKLLSNTAPPSMLGQMQILSLADSVFPVGGLAQSFGLETAVAKGMVTEQNLAEYLEDWCQETLLWEAAFCREGHHLGRRQHAGMDEAWRQLNQELSAYHVGRESRQASLRIGGRFWQLITVLCPTLTPPDHGGGAESHYAPSFGFVTGALGLEEELVLASFFTQGLTQMVSAAQRLLPLGQMAAMQIVWQAKPLLCQLVTTAMSTPRHEISFFTPVGDVAVMGHPYLATRLFLS